MDRESTRTDVEGVSNVKPVVVVSECLGFGAVRYNGQILRSRFVEALKEHVGFVQVCPEVGVGLGVPRDPVRLVDDEGRLRMIQPATGRDLTEAMEGFSAAWLSSYEVADGFILKSRSPTCGIADVRVYRSAGKKAPRGKATGLFAKAVLQRFPLAAVEDEGRLTNLRIRHHFLATLFTVARFRGARQKGTMRALVRFQTEHKLLLMAHGQGVLRRLGRLAAGSEELSPHETFQRYGELLGPALRSPARPGPVVNVLQHAAGYLSDVLNREERAFFLNLLEEYRLERVSLSALLTVLRAWIVRHGEPYLQTQRFFSPYPRALLELTDSGLRSRV